MRSHWSISSKPPECGPSFGLSVGKLGAPNRSPKNHPHTVGDRPPWKRARVATRASIFATAMLTSVIVAGRVDAFRVIDRDRAVACQRVDEGLGLGCGAVEPGVVSVSYAARLSSTTIRYWIDARSMPAALQLDEVRVAVREAASGWEKVDGLDTSIRFIEDDEPDPLLKRDDGVVVIHWGDINSDDVATTSVSMVTTTGEWVSGADIRLDAQLEWTTTKRERSARRYLQSVLAHEFGHVLGLDHSRNAAAMMCTEVAEPCQKQRQRAVSLAGDDVNGIRYLYGSNASPDIAGVNPEQAVVSPGEVVEIIVNATDGEGDELRYEWDKSGGTFERCTRTNNRCVWRAPAKHEKHVVVVGVRDVQHRFYQYKVVDLVVGSPTATLSVQLASNPSQGRAPLTIGLTATVAGTAKGKINYAFYCRRADAGTDIDPSWDKFVRVSHETLTATNACTYSVPGTYTAKVVVERGKALRAEAQTTIVIRGCGNSIREDGEQCDGSDDIACPGLCATNCICLPTPSPTHSPTMSPTPSPTSTPHPTPSAPPGPPWPMFGRDRRHTGASAAIGPQFNTVRWSFPTGGAVRGSPVIGHANVIYFSSADGRLYALNPDGTLFWQWNFGMPVEHAAAIGSDGTVYVPVGGTLHSFSATGELRWSFTPALQFGTGAQNFSGPMVIDSNGALFGVVVRFDGVTVRGYLLAINDNGGSATELWRIGNTFSHAAGVAPDGRIYAVKNRHLTAVGADGTAATDLDDNGPLTVLPVIDGEGSAYIGSGFFSGVQFGGFYKVVRADGTTKWGGSGHIVAFRGTGAKVSALAFGRIHFVASNSLVARDAETGASIWSFPLSLNNSNVFEGGASPAVDVEGSVYVGSSVGVMYGISASGIERWRYPTGGAINTQPAIASDGTLYVGSDDGTLYAFGE